jgi:hypothetical protein
LLAFAGQQESASDPIEEPQAELLLKSDDLPGQGRLRDTQAQRCL